MTLERWQPVIPVLREFDSALSKHVPPTSVLAASDGEWSDEEYERLRPKGFPSNLRGVYLLFDSPGELLYVGLAMWCFDKRVWSHDSEMDRRWVDIIPFDDQHIFLAPALEFFLIARLSPPYNKTYKGHTIPPAR